ncbi:MAG: flagellar hook assembly protein FlgD [Sphingomonadales bacterium]|nr:flagellar hook assembly protein FlgD [Sphingomonadales bacterium]
MATTTSAFDSAMSNAGIATSAAIKAAANQKSANSKTLNEMGPGDFIALLTAQMKNQDPFEPVDNSQMVAQMAQFSSLAGISEMGSTLKSIATKLSASTASEAMSYVGKTVLTEGKTAYPRASGGIAGAVELDSAATSVTVTIMDKNGAPVRSFDMGAKPAGSATFDWDGKLEDGTDTEGPYTLSAIARDGTRSVSSRTLVWAPVTSATLPNGSEPVLSLPGIGDVKASAVRAVA